MKLDAVRSLFFTPISRGSLRGFVDLPDLRKMLPEEVGEWRWFIRPVQIPNGYICLRWRVLFYLFPWLGVLAAFFLLWSGMPEEGPQQAVEIVVSTPMMVALGLAHLLCGGDFTGPVTFWLVGLGMAVHAVLMLSSARLTPLIALLVLQILFLGIAAAGVFHLSNLPSGA